MHILLRGVKKHRKDTKVYVLTLQKLKNIAFFEAFLQFLDEKLIHINHFA